MADIKLTQGQRIRHAREVAGLEQTELAALLHVGRSTVSNWERDLGSRGVPYPALRLIAEVTGFDVEFFEGRELAFTATDNQEYFLAGQLELDIDWDIATFDIAARSLRAILPQRAHAA
jgi:transcriptional regulator with XRE-family HTH domain